MYPSFLDAVHKQRNSSGRMRLVKRLSEIDRRHSLLPLARTRSLQVTFGRSDSRVPCILLSSSKINVPADCGDVCSSEFVKVPMRAIGISQPAMAAASAPKSVEIDESFQLPNHARIRFTFRGLDDEHLSRMILFPFP
jgi:hypothetical protein